AHIIGLTYLHRWTIELFFRWLKMYANFEHMISHSPRGVETWFYVAMIGTLLMSLYTQQEPSTYAFTAMRLIISGEAQYEDLAPQLARLARERELARKRYAQRRAAKKSV
ncbi:MAG: transposase, partial [Phycisphaerae bacterium]